MRRQLCARVVLEERHELRLEDIRRRQVRRHDAEEPVSRERGDALRHRRATLAEVDEGLGERVDERVQVEQRLDFGSGKNQHRHAAGDWRCMDKANRLEQDMAWPCLYKANT